MAESPERTDPLVDHLERLASRQDRATLALLRGTFQKEHALDGLAVVLPFVAQDSRWRDRAEDDALLVSGLFALHPESGSLLLPDALRVIAKTSESVELRFRALLSASRQDLVEHLRHAVTLVASHGLAIDWRDLHAAIRYWDHPSDRMRRRWARAFWASESSSQPAKPRLRKGPPT
jgi:CRISPR type I-E-associated protein CasB/Cse2